MKGRRKPPMLGLPTQKAEDKICGISSDGTLAENDVSIGVSGLKISQDKGSADAKGLDNFLPGSKAESKDTHAEVRLEDLKRLEVLGEGSSGIVQKVQHKVTGQVLALKVVPVQVSIQMRKQILLELKTLYSSSPCPQIVRFYGAFMQEGAISMALEFMEGGTLHDVMKQRGGKLSEAELKTFTLQILTGLKYLHKQQRVVHRDIKPSNLLLNGQGQVKLSDFGMSGQLENSVDVKMSFVGTATYMAPERIRGDKYSFPSDVWSLGITLVECATGRFPYPAPGPDGRQEVLSNFFDLLDCIQSEPAPTLPDDGSFSVDFQSFVQQCVHKEASARASASALLDHPWIKGVASGTTHSGSGCK